MSQIALEILILFALLLANGIFAMAEIAVVSSRKGKLQRLANEGDRRAQAALELAESPNRFLSTVQVGITLVGIVAGAFGGARLTSKLAPVLAGVPGLAPYAENIAFGIIVVIITYFSLILGELVPKRLGLSRPESIAMTVARPMNWLSSVAAPIVTLLSASTDGLLRVLGFKPQQATSVSEEEVKGLMQEGLRAGAFNQVETDIIQNALDLDQLSVRDIMTPRAKIIWLNRTDTHETVWHKIVVSGHTFFPVYEDHRDNVVGIVSIKSIYANVAAGTAARISDLMTKPLIVPATQNVIKLLDSFKSSAKHIAMVTDEFGGMVGLVTLHDVMEVFVGKVPSAEQRAQPAIKKREDGTWLVDAMIGLAPVEKALPGFRFPKNAGDEYQTLAGYVVKHLGHIPKEGDTYESQGYVFEVLDMDRHRVDKILVLPAKKSPDLNASSDKRSD